MNAAAIAGVADAPTEGHMSEKKFHDAYQPNVEAASNSGESKP